MVKFSVKRLIIYGRSLNTLQFLKHDKLHCLSYELVLTCVFLTEQVEGNTHIS